MNIQALTEFFMWCTIINGGVLILWTLFVVFAPDVVFKVQSKFITIPRETFDVVIYSFLGLFKIFFIVFNVTPYVALLVTG